MHVWLMKKKHNKKWKSNKRFTARLRDKHTPHQYQGLWPGSESSWTVGAGSLWYWPCTRAGWTGGRGHWRPGRVYWFVWWRTSGACLGPVPGWWGCRRGWSPCPGSVVWSVTLETKVSLENYKYNFTPGFTQGKNIFTDRKNLLLITFKIISTKIY